ncbi:uncharacterized protein LOC131323721 [Rhododendron vialii]|uniref:uncharacterized protein LOC131323721 n=1 Tax=Rhododendron vialii TaxID=182163 RepID=UPI00265DE190|nr:uncharacterized protein LOC131323721 [Rhododendron vialii]
MEDSRSHEVSVDKSSNHVSCSYKMFEFDGCPCRHMLAYLFIMQIRELTSKFILQKWTKTAKSGRVMDDLGNEAGTKVVREALLASQKKIALMRNSCQDGSTSSIQLPISLGSQHGLKEPLEVRVKSCGKCLKGGKEKAIKKSRKCYGCGLTGQSHDKRNCPMLMNISSQDVRLDDDDDDFDEEYMEMKFGRHIET